MRKFVPHSLVTQSSELKDKSAEPAPGHEDAYTFASFFVERLLIEFLLEVVIHFINEWRETLFALKGSQD